MVVALIVDGLLVLIGRAVLPWARMDKRQRGRMPLVPGEAASAT
jgi:hypothetical protein